MAIKSDFDDAVEFSLGEEESSEEDITAEYVENEKIDEEYAKRCLSGSPLVKPGSIVQQVSEYLSDSPCCTKNCVASFQEEDLIKHAEDMKHLSKKEKKLVLLTVLRNSVTNTESTRYSTPRQRLHLTLRYEPFGIMCKAAFQLLFDIRIKELKGLLAHLKSNSMSIIPPQHGNSGKKTHRSNSLADRGVNEKVIEFILALGESQGEFSAGRHTKLGNTSVDKNPDMLWLPACLTQSAILRMYDKQHPDFPISRIAFSLLLKKEPRLQHIRIRVSRTDMCDFCEFQKRKIAGTKLHDEVKAEKLTAKLLAHQKSYQEERALYNSEREQSKLHRKEFGKGKRTTDECIEHISMDYGQSIAVPHTAVKRGGTFYLHMRNFLLFGIFSVLENTQHCYTYDEREAAKGANEIISFLHDFFFSRQIKAPNIRIHADNCTGQNKNKYVMWYLVWLVSFSPLKRAEIKFMIKGHTHFIVDSGIGHTKRELRRSDVFCLKHWAEVINRSAKTNKAKVVTGNNVYDWKKGLSHYFKTFTGISKFQHFVSDCSEPGWIWAKYGVDDDTWKKTKLLKSDSILLLEEFKKLPKDLSTVGFKGGKFKKEKMLFENMRQYVKDSFQDELCPDPETFESPIRDKQICPDWT